MRDIDKLEWYLDQLLAYGITGEVRTINGNLEFFFWNVKTPGKQWNIGGCQKGNEKGLMIHPAFILATICNEHHDLVDNMLKQNDPVYYLIRYDREFTFNWIKENLIAYELVDKYFFEVQS